MVAVQHDDVTPEDLTSGVKESTDAVCELVKSTVTSCLQYPDDMEDEDEKDYFWRPIPSQAAEEDYENDVRRLLFPPEMDFRLDENNEFISTVTKLHYYRYQCTNQMHRCMDTCWKYNYYADEESRKCRFHYPVPQERSDPNECCIYSLYDSKKRKQTKINAPRNNGWVNPLPTHPLMVFANQANMDLQYISNASGAVEYTCGYISKEDQPDQKVLINIFTKKLAQAVLRSDNEDATHRQQLDAAGTAIAGSQHLGTVQCAYTMLKLPYVLLSRPVYTISPSPTQKLTKNIVTDMKQLAEMNPKDSTVSTSAKSHAGRRYAYHLLCQQQYEKYGVCNISLSCIVATYAISKPKRIRKDGTAVALIEPKLLTTDEYGRFIFNILSTIIYINMYIYMHFLIGEIENIDATGYSMFDVSEFRFKVHVKPSVLRMAPYIRTNEEDEESTHAMLLLYVPWPKEGEENLFRGEASAIEAFAKLKSLGELPTYVLTQIASCKKSEDILNDLGDIVYSKDDNLSEADGDDENDSGMESDDDDYGSNVAGEGGLLEDCNGFNGDKIVMDEPDANEDAMDTSSKYAREGVEVISTKQHAFYRQYINNQINAFFNQYMEENSVSDTTTRSSSSNNSHTQKIPMDNEEERTAALNERRARMTPDQRHAFDTIWPYIRDNIYILQYIAGGAGVGKSEVIKCIIEATRLYYGKQLGKYGSVLIMGPTGSAAHNIGGFTWQSVLGKGREKTKQNQYAFLTQQKAEEIYSHIKGVKLIIIDEISMVSLESLHEISRRICEVMCTSIADPRERARINNRPFAGIPTILCGDLYQLSCVGGTPIYADSNLNIAAAAGRKIWKSIHLYHNFTISTRFARDSDAEIPPLESFLRGARTGNPVIRYIHMLNTQICINYEDACKKCHDKAVWLCSTHAEKDPINRFMFDKLKGKGAFNMDILAKHTRNDCPNDYMTRKEREQYYAKTGKDRAPVLLRLAIGSRVKITENLGTSIGKNYSYTFLYICIYTIP